MTVANYVRNYWRGAEPVSTDLDSAFNNIEAAVSALDGASTPLGTFAPLASPHLTGVPTAPTAAPLTDTTQLATTAYADLAVGVETTRATAVEAAKVASVAAANATITMGGTATAPTVGVTAGTYVDTTTAQAVAGVKTWSSDGLFASGRPFVDTKAKGAKLDAVVVTDGAMNGTDGILTCATSHPFAVGNVGMPITVTLAGTSVNEVQTLTITGAPSGGTFTLTFNGQTTSALAYNALASAVQTALVALSSIGANNVTVTGSAGGPYTVTFVGALASAPQNYVTATTSFTGGSSPGITSAETTFGQVGLTLCTTIASYQSTSQVTLTAVSVTAVTGATVTFGTDDTTAVQAAITAAVALGQCGVLHMGGNSMVGGLTCAGTGVTISGGGTLTQKASGANLIDISNSTDCTVTGLRLVGVGGSTVASSNNAVFGTNAVRARVVSNDISGFLLEAVFLLGATDSVVERNVCWALSHGMLFVQATNLVVTRNVVRDPQTPSRLFIHGISFDSDGGFPSFTGANTDVEVVGNVVKNYVNAQGILAHRLQQAVIAHNVLDNVREGVGLIRTGVGDAINAIMVEGNYVNCTSTGDAFVPGGGGSIPSNYGIKTGGGSTYQNDHVDIVGNVVKNANAIVQSVSQGGIGLDYSNYVSVRSNQVSGAYCNGVVVNNPCLVLDITGNSIDGVVTANAQQSGIELTSNASTSTGVIGPNTIDGGGGLTSCIRSDMTSTGVAILAQTLVGTWTSAITNPSKAGVLVKPGTAGGQNSISGASTPVNTTVYRNNTGRFVWVWIPVYSTGGTGPFTVAVAIGDTSSPTTAITFRVDEASTASTNPTQIAFLVPPGCWWSPTKSDSVNLTFGALYALAQ